jgi:hypothetical protein
MVKGCFLVGVSGAWSSKVEQLKRSNSTQLSTIGDWSSSLRLVPFNLQLDFSVWKSDLDRLDYMI